VTYWYRRHLNRWIAVCETDGQHWNYGASVQMEQATAAGTAQELADAMRAADELVPLHTCSEELCGRWHMITVAGTEVKLMHPAGMTEARRGRGMPDREDA
jgi:hypothetical protein